jgi:hypothetical protein
MSKEKPLRLKLITISGNPLLALISARIPPGPKIMSKMIHKPPRFYLEEYGLDNKVYLNNSVLNKLALDQTVSISLNI